MKRIKIVEIGFLNLFLLSCAGDIRGKDAVLNPLIHIHRPSYHSISKKLISIEASSTVPAVFKFGSELRTATNQLLCDITLSNGAGGLRSGLTNQPDTIYYLYGITNGSGVALIGDTNPPTQGPENFANTDWTFIGSFWTRGGGFLPHFVGSNGRFESEDYFGSGNISDTNYHAVTTIPMPITIKQSLGFLEVAGPNDIQKGVVSGTDFSGWNPPQISRYVNLSAANNVSQGFQEVPIETVGTIFVQSQDAANHASWNQTGWIEDPLEYQ